MPNFLEPTFEELQYHQKFLKSRKTMAFHHGKETYFGSIFSFIFAV